MNTVTIELTQEQLDVLITALNKVIVSSDDKSALEIAKLYNTIFLQLEVA